MALSSWWELSIIAICWPLCLIYIFLIVFIVSLSKWLGLPQTCREQLRLNGVMNVCFYLHTELLLRPIVYEWFWKIEELPEWLPRAMYVSQMWHCNTFRALFCLVWVVSVIFALPAAFASDVGFKQGYAHYELTADTELLARALSFILSSVAVALTTGIYAACIIRYHSLKFHRRKNCQLFFTSLTAYPPFVVYTLKCILELVSQLCANKFLQEFSQSTWFWLYDIQTILPAIPLLLLTSWGLRVLSRIMPIEKSAGSTRHSHTIGQTSQVFVLPNQDGAVLQQTLSATEGSQTSPSTPSILVIHATLDDDHFDISEQT